MKVPPLKRPSRRVRPREVNIQPPPKRSGYETKAVSSEVILIDRLDRPDGHALETMRKKARLKLDAEHSILTINSATDVRHCDGPCDVKDSPPEAHSHVRAFPEAR